MNFYYGENHEPNKLRTGGGQSMSNNIPAQARSEDNLQTAIKNPFDSGYNNFLCHKNILFAGGWVPDYFIGYYLNTITPPLANNTLANWFFCIFVLLLYLVALTNFLVVNFGDIEKFPLLKKFYSTFACFKYLSIYLLFFATYLTSIFLGVNVFAFLLTGMLFIFLGVHYRSKCKDKIRWPLVMSGALLLYYSFISLMGKSVEYIAFFKDFAKFTVLLSFVLIMLDHTIYLRNRCL